MATIRVDSIKSSRINNIFNPPYIVQGRYIFFLAQNDFRHVKLTEG